MSAARNRQTFHMIHVAGFFFAANMALAAYVSSSFLVPLVGARAIGIVYATAALAALLLINSMPQAIATLGAQRVTALLVVGSYGSLLTLYGSGTPALSVLAFIIYYALGISVMYWLRWLTILATLKIMVLVLPVCMRWPFRSSHMSRS